MRFSREGYWSGLPFPSPGDLPDPGIEPGSSALQADSLPTELPAAAAAAAAKLLQSCPTLCNPIDGSPPGFPVPEILQARVLEWVTISFSLSHVQLFATPWTVAHQSPLSMEFSRQEYWSGLPFPHPGDLPDPGIKPGSSALQADSLLTELQGKPIFTDIQMFILLKK